MYSYCEWLLANIKLVISMFDKACLLLCNFKILIMYDEKKLLFMLLLICMLGGCKDEKHDSVLNLFSESQQLFQEKENLIKDEFLAVIEGMTCNEEYLIVYDLHSGDSYTLLIEKQVHILLVLEL